MMLRLLGLTLALYVVWFLLSIRPRKRKPSPYDPRLPRTLKQHTLYRTALFDDDLPDLPEADELRRQRELGHEVGED